MARSFEDDVRDVAAVQEGDSQAFSRLVEEYRPNLVKVARQYDDSLPSDQAFDLILSAWGEWLMTATAKDAQYLRNNIRHVAQRAVNGYLHSDLDRNMIARAQAALTDIQPRVGDPNEPAEPLSLKEAAEKHKVSLQTLMTFMGLHGAGSVSFETVMDEALTPDDEALFAGGFDDQVVEPHLDPEFMDAPMVFEFDVCESSDGQSPAGVASVEFVVDRLSEKQREVASLLANGMTQREVARALDTTPGAVSSHVRAIRERFEAAGLQPDALSHV